MINILTVAFAALMILGSSLESVEELVDSRVMRS